MSNANVDWKKVKLDFEVNGLEVPELSKKYGIKSQTIHSRKNRENWTKRLKEEVRARTQELLALTANLPVEEAKSVSGLSNGEAKQAVEEAAVANAMLVMRHKAGIIKGNELLTDFETRLYEQLSKNSRIIQTKEGAVEIDLDLDYLGKALQTVTRTRGQLIQLERQAFGLDEKGQVNDGVSLEQDFTGKD